MDELDKEKIKDKQSPQQTAITSVQPSGKSHQTAYVIINK